MFTDFVIRKKFEDRLKKQEEDRIVLKSMAIKIQDELNALMVEEMHLQSMLRLVKEEAVSTTTAGTDGMSPNSSGTGTAPANEDNSLPEELNLKLLTTLVPQQGEEEEEVESDDTEGESDEGEDEEEAEGTFGGLLQSEDEEWTDVGEDTKFDDQAVDNQAADSDSEKMELKEETKK